MLWQGLRGDNRGFRTDPAATRTVVYDDPAPGDYREELTDPKEQTTTFHFDELGRVVDVFDATPEAGQTQIAYDLRGNVTRLIDPEGAQTRFERDAAFRVVQVDRPYAAGPLVTELDELGNPYRITKPDGCELETRFDAMSRMLERRSTSACPAGAPPIDERFGYDARGNLVAAQNAHVGLLREYDALDRLTREIDDRFGSSVAYLYDDASRLTTKIYPDSSIVQLSYDAAGRAIGITDSMGTGAASSPGGDTTRYAYDAAGRRVESVSTSGLRTRLSYDENGRLEGMSGYRTNGSVATSLLYPEYDEAGNRTAKADGTGTTAYAYDALHRLVGETPPAGDPVHYAYDRAGNRTHSGKKLGGAWASPYVTYDYDDATTVTHRLLSATTDGAATLHAFPAYDANGNPTQWNNGAGLRTLTWDALDRLVAIGGAFQASYAYDPFGRRIEKTEQGTTRRYQYDGLDPVAEYAAAGTPTATYLFGPGLDEPLKIKRGALLAAYHGDGLGSVTAVSKMGGNAAYQVTYRYDAFGETTVLDTFENAYAFTGRELDQSGLYYYRARYYLPAVGRFLTPDPIGLAGGSHPYVYVSSNPVNFRDPFGLAAAGTQAGPVSNRAAPDLLPTLSRSPDLAASPLLAARAAAALQSVGAYSGSQSGSLQLDQAFLGPNQVATYDAAVERIRANDPGLLNVPDDLSEPPRVLRRLGYVSATPVADSSLC